MLAQPPPGQRDAHCHVLWHFVCTDSAIPDPQGHSERKEGRSKKPRIGQREAGSRYFVNARLLFVTLGFPGWHSRTSTTLQPKLEQEVTYRQGRGRPVRGEVSGGWETPDQPRTGRFS